ncbi:hypothetical protein B566_EDAN013055 [Ephemera danica]|nr:hypothetical protein B566_EDAN013055 [Ephemera danica]
MSRLSRALKLIGIVWTVALCCAIPQAAQFGVIHENTEHANCVVKRVILAHSFEISTFLFFVAPMLLISVLYALIGIKLRRSNMMRRGSDCKDTRKASASLNSQSQDRHESIRGRNSTNLRRS